ncbi:MAG: right-handed parallel beta-helix repeat-containing protein, partial [Clostridia bacterium]|nr:right-handed parallel beta-helix repeat-containing protein [Clostridia bacterium]
MRIIDLNDFRGDDDRARIAAALLEAKKEPGTKLVIAPGVYRITTERSREIRECVMSGEYGECPEPVMFSPDFPYDRGIDLSGHKGTVIDAVGAKLIVDGFMEDISIRDCEGVTVRGFEIDNAVKPYTKALVLSVDGSRAAVRFSKEITARAPIVRTAVYSNKYSRFIPEICDVDKLVSADGKDGVISLKGDVGEVKAGDEIYLCHTFHFRPSVLIENASNIRVEDVTVHSHAGMGLTAFHAENVTLDRFRVVPSKGERFSTNTDATHFTSCSGYLKITNCEFEGQGDDGINVHTYYYTPAEHSGRRAKLKIMSPTWTHTQKMDSPFVGDTAELTDKMTLDPKDEYKVISVERDDADRSCTVTLDRDLPGDMSPYLLADPDRTPRLEV